MTFLEQLNIIKRLDYLIRRKATGGPQQLADKLQISKASTYRYIETMKNLGAPIEYCKNRNTYYYSKPDFKLQL